MKRLKELWLQFRLWLAFERIVWFYESTGSEQPLLDALQEVEMRSYLEGLRDYCSDRYRKDRGHLEQYKQEWMDDYMKPLSRASDKWKMIATIRNITKNMLPDELLHKDVYKLFLDDMEAYAKEVRARKPTMLEKYQQRVLLGSD